LIVRYLEVILQQVKAVIPYKIKHSSKATCKKQKLPIGKCVLYSNQKFIAVQRQLEAHFSTGEKSIRQAGETLNGI
jgi:hypothetical protein